MKYAGRWHTEGQTENIVAVGVYYLHIDEKLEGGTLKFRPQRGPQNWYDGIELDHEVTSSCRIPNKQNSGFCILM